VWRKSSFSGNEYECVEVVLGQGQVLARDSKDRTGPVLAFPAVAWSEFLTALVDGELDGS
jgi:hypothetical protein